MSPRLIAALRETQEYALALASGALPAEALCFALTAAQARFKKRGNGELEASP